LPQTLGLDRAGWMVNTQTRRLLRIVVRGSANEADSWRPSGREMAVAREIAKSIPGAVWLVHTIRNDTPSITRRIRRALRRRPNVFFVQVGSNDGLHGDPSRPLIYNDIRFSGIFIEPLSAVFERLKSNYGNEGALYIH
jgi:hypothetical protein